MFELSVGELAGYISKRFLLGVLLPVFLFCALAVVSVGLAMGPGAAIAALQELNTATHLWLLAILLTVVTALASVVDHGMVLLIHLYEGYWPSWEVLERHRESCLRRQRDRRQALREAAKRYVEELLAAEHREQVGRANPSDSASQTGSQASGAVHGEADQTEGPPAPKDEARKKLGDVYGRLAATFPEDDAWLLPTRLGNILAAAEAYSERAYGIDAVTVWPRLAQYLPEDFRNQVSESGTGLTSMLLSATVAIPFSIGYGLIAILVGGVPWFLAFAVALPAGILLAVGFHRLALQHAREYGLLIRIAWDLYRHDLLLAQNVPLPATPVEESELWRQLAGWWSSSLPPEVGVQGQSAWTFRWTGQSERGKEDS